jgi:chromosome segregation protein
MLRRLELTGFKSFAKKISLDFGAPISAVVGPNGSGKSNVADALRWALGEQSLKSLRGKRGEDLIWNGSREAPRQNQATVSVTFDNRQKKFNLDYDEVTLTRRVYRDGANEYLVNGTQVRLKDIIELLSSVGIGASSHHIISQGEADRILNTSPQERREMIEDALGLKIYEYKREESEKKLEKTEENLRQVEALRQEIIPHLKFLKKQAEKIESAEILREELRTLYYQYFKKQESYLEGERRLLAEERKGLEAGLKEAEAKLAEYKDRSPASGHLEAELREAESVLQNIRREKDELARKVGKLEGIIEARTIPKTIALGTKCRYCGQVIASPSAQLNAAEDEDLARRKDEKAAAEQRMQELWGEELKLLVRAEELKKTIEDEREKFREAEREMYEAKSRRSELQSRADAVRAWEEKLRVEAEDFRIELGEAQKFAGPIVLEYNERARGEDDNIEQQERRKKIEKMKFRLEDAGGLGTEVLKEYREASEREAFLSRESEDLVKSAESLKSVIADLGERLNEEFKNGIKKINEQFSAFFSLMFGGGAAALEVMPDKAGIEVSVSLPRKKIKGLEMLSGGERALTSIALLFAMSQVNPPPFLVLDETDAALDESNSRKYGDMLEALAKYSQLILITHNRETMSRAGVLYGVTMGADGISRLLSIKFDEALQVAK